MDTKTNTKNNTNTNTKKKINRMPTALFLALCLLCIAGIVRAADSAKEKKNQRFHIEIDGGYGIINPSDLNARTDFDIASDFFNTRDRYNHYQQMDPDFFSFSGGMEGELKKIKHTLPLGFRLKYDLNSSVSLSLGIRFHSREETSRSVFNYHVQSVNPSGVLFYDEYTVSRENSPYILSAKGVCPMVGLHYRLNSHKALSFEGLVSGGVVFASCRFQRERTITSINSYGFGTEQKYDYEIDGKGTGIALEAALRMNLRVMKHLQFFLEGGYAYQKAGNITGGGSIRRSNTDSESEGIVSNGTWEGDWVMVTGAMRSEWGSVDYSYPDIRRETDTTRDFTLDFSGPRLRVGISLDF
ncbi:MAG: hypothetical protein GY765_05600 [bacterium]|nr:hypothetical protein [bacterium]